MLSELPDYERMLSGVDPLEQPRKSQRLAVFLICVKGEKQDE